MVLLLAHLSQAADWPQFEGPNRNGISPETGILRQWPDGGPKVLWTSMVGVGYGGPAIKDGKIYLLDRPDDKQDVLRCLSLETGEELWGTAYDAPGKLSHDGSRSVPTVDDRHVYTVGPFADLYCFNLETHQPVWHKNLYKEFGLKQPTWGSAQSAVLYKDLIVVAPLSPTVGLVAFHKATGEEAWRSPNLPGQLGYVTVATMTLDGVEQFVIISAKGVVAGVAPDDGKILWTYDGWECQIPIPSPTFAGGNRVFITGGYKSGSTMLEVTRVDGTFNVKSLFKLDGYGGQLQQPIVHEGHIYMDNCENGRMDGVLCLTLDGTPKWRTRDIDGGPRYDRGNLLFADGVIFAIDKQGALRMFEANSEAYKELGSADLLGGNEIWAPMALSQGRLVIRDQSKIMCVEVARQP
jgi:outer membrane protein assembly factor BamB